MSGSQVPVPQAVYTATKAIAATITTGLGVLGLFVADIADGSLDWNEGGTLIGAAATAVATIAAVWGATNKKKPLG